MKRILFVDDAPNILDGLKRMLYSQRRVWDMAFVSSGEGALKAMEAEPFDVVVTDMRMPGMNGATLLRHVQERYPGTVRIVLSGHADLQASMRSVAVSHQFLTKPCEPDVLKDVVERACSLASLLSRSALRDTLGGVGKLPVLPKVYQALTQALAEPEVDLGQVGAIVEQDLGIAAKILQLVNSSFFCLRREITSLRQATTYLGVNTLRDLVLSCEVFRQFESARVVGFSAEREQRHSLLTARIAKRLLDDKNAAETAFLTAMLHDIGKLVLAAHLPAQLEKVLEAGASGDRPLYLVEEELFDVSHSEIGAYLLGLWGMPYPVIEAVANHHRPSRVAGQRTFGLLGAVHVADVLAKEQGEGTASTVTVDDAYLQALGIADRLPGWRAIAAKEAGDGQEAA